MPGSERPVTVTFLPTAADAFSDGSSKYSRWEPVLSLISRQLASTPASTVPVTVCARPVDGSTEGDGDAEADADDAGAEEAGTEEAEDADEPVADGELPAQPATHSTSVKAMARRRVSMILGRYRTKPSSPRVRPGAAPAGP